MRKLSVLIIVLIIVGLFLFIFLVIWLDWTYKCRKSAKDNSLMNYLTVFYMFGSDKQKSEITILDGIMGVNTTQLVFANRFKDESIYLRTEISDINDFKFANYNDDEILAYVNKQIKEDKKATYIIRTMAGISISKRIPKGLKTRMMCELNINNGAGVYFFYKDTPKNTEKINEIQKRIQAINIK